MSSLAVFYIRRQGGGKETRKEGETYGAPRAVHASSFDRLSLCPSKMKSTKGSRRRRSDAIQRELRSLRDEVQLSAGGRLGAAAGGGREHESSKFVPQLQTRQRATSRPGKRKTFCFLYIHMLRWVLITCRCVSCIVGAGRAGRALTPIIASSVPVRLRNNRRPCTSARVVEFAPDRVEQSRAHVPHPGVPVLAAGSLSAPREVLVSLLYRVHPCDVPLSLCLHSNRFAPRVAIVCDTFVVR